MSGSVNMVILAGNLGKDPEVKNLSNGKSVCNFSIATSETWKDRDGERQEKTEWHNCQVWQEGLIKVIEQYLSKGDKVHVVGKIQTRKWEDQDGKDRYSTEIVVDKLTMLSTKGNGGGRDDDDRGGRSRSRDDDGGGRSRGADEGGRSRSRSRDDDRGGDDRGGGRSASRSSSRDDRGRDDDRGSSRSSSRSSSRNNDMDDDIPF
ncbi:single-stranded DNA-binding protein [Bradyrhizobium sp. SZCCHNPS1003]|uniref:single-stranded DNA-binding protein n=1 Tax=Bradyrhizobium sp. SZCCHNPS1003 TaxID=3057330 RepID=UPI0028E20297|nr:single-stranded DNA-binding protein [Bradyrhizobium sp. SZCCHNPS1003]